MKLKLLLPPSLAIIIIVVIFFSVTPEERPDILKVLALGGCSALVGFSLALAGYASTKVRERKLRKGVQALLKKLKDENIV